MYSTVLYAGRDPPDCESGIESSFITLFTYSVHKDLLYAFGSSFESRVCGAPDKASTACSHNLSAKCLLIFQSIPTYLEFMLGSGFTQKNSH